MALFYFSTDGDENWNMCGRNSTMGCNLTLTEVLEDDNQKINGTDVWLAPVHACYWGGLACVNSTMCFDRIEFEGNNVGGSSIPSELGELSDLRFLLLEGANNVTEFESGRFELFQGTIPTQLMALPQLASLDLNFNNLSGLLPDNIGDLTNLQQLDINHNVLSGKIPSSIGQNIRLSFLQLHDNEFTGVIPSYIGLLTDLKFLQLHANRLTGQIPSDLGLLTKLRRFDLFANEFSSDMPNEVCQLRNTTLESLTVDCINVTCPDILVQNVTQSCCTNCDLA